MSKEVLEYYDDWGCDETDPDICNDHLMNQFSKICEVIDKEYVPLVMESGTINLWNGSYELKDLMIFYSIDDFLKKLRDTDRLVIKVYDNEVEVENHHHDGTNYYTLKSLKKLDSYDLRDIIYNYVPNDVVEEYLNEVKVPDIDLLDRSDLIEIIEKYAK